MRTFVGVMVMSFVAACVHPIPLAPVEQCGMQNMAVQGLSMSTGTTVAVASSGGYFTTAGARSYDESVACGRFASREDACAAEAGRASAVIKMDWSPGWRNVVTFVGYCAFLLPGIMMSVAFIGEEHDARTAAATAYSNAYQGCMSRGEVSAPPTTASPAAMTFCYVAGTESGGTEERCSPTLEECRDRYDHADDRRRECAGK